ncbi:MAG TPA: hypothetical protein VKW06_16200 [Candidatus Angelobacter sp.]|nr:hypothetical protein [Candidatus Angelobacter sp.]
MQQTKTRYRDLGDPDAIHKWTKEQALQLLKTYEETDEPTDVWFGVGDIGTTAAGYVKLVHDALYIEAYCIDAEFIDELKEAVIFKLSPNVQFEYVQGTYHLGPNDPRQPHHVWDDDGNPTQLHITNPKTGEFIDLWDLPGKPSFIPLVGEQINWEQVTLPGKKEASDLA